MGNDSRQCKPYFVVDVNLIMPLIFELGGRKEGLSGIIRRAIQVEGGSHLPGSRGDNGSAV
jgi:hypothetical protein